MWLLLLLGPLLLLQRKVHFEIQAVLLFLTRRVEIVTVLFSLLFLPGVIVHELSHFIVAQMVGVRTGRFSLLPRNLGNGKLQLGYVETSSSDILRDSTIGAAPLLFGGIIIFLIAKFRLGFGDLTSVLDLFGSGFSPEMIVNLIRVPDFWLWFYLMFAVCSTMLPSASDRRAWLPLTGLLVLLGGTGIVLGIGPWMMSSLVPALNSLVKILALVFGISAFIHLVLLLPLVFLRLILGKVTGLELRTG